VLRVGKENKEEERRRKKEKGNGKKKEKESGAGGIRGDGRPRTRCGVRPVSDEHAEQEKGKGDSTAIGTGVGTADRREFFWGKQDLG